MTPIQIKLQEIADRLSGKACRCLRWYDEHLSAFADSKSEHDEIMNLQKATTQLIDAAPELLECLFLLVNAMEAPETPGKDGIIEMRMAEAKIIIAKTTNQQTPVAA